MRAPLPRLFTLIAMVALIAACAGTASPSPAAPSNGASPVPTEAPTATADASESAEPSASGLDLEGAAGAIDDLDTFQLDVHVSGFVPTPSGESAVEMTVVVDRPNDAIQMKLSGMADLGTGSQGIDIIVVGNDAWINPGTGAYVATPGGAANFATIKDELSPATLLSEVPEDAFSSMKLIGAEEKNGDATTRYHLDSSVPGFAESMGEDGEADIWIANDGSYLVSMTMSGTTEVEGESVDIAMQFDVSRVNDPSISIQAPS